MKRYVLTIAALIIFPSAITFAAEKDLATDAGKAFYKANAYYENREYAKAVEEYLKILDSGIESGSLYYNIGNSFFKLGKTGYAILCYERAKRLMPGDSDLRSNLDYAKSFVEDGAFTTMTTNKFALAIGKPSRDLSLSQVAASAAVFYIAVILFSAANLVFPAFLKKARVFYMLLLAVFFFNLAVFVMRYHNEEILKHGVVLQKEAECKYEPIEKSTTYYKIHEGQDVLILNTKNGWRQIKRPDGKIAWVKKEAVEEI